MPHSIPSFASVDDEADCANEPDLFVALVSGDTPENEYVFHSITVAKLRMLLTRLERVPTAILSTDERGRVVRTIAELTHEIEHADCACHELVIQLTTDEPGPGDLSVMTGMLLLDLLEQVQ